MSRASSTSQAVFVGSVRALRHCARRADGNCGAAVIAVQTCARPAFGPARYGGRAVINAGRIVFGLAMIALGIFCFRGDFFYTWSGIPDGLPARAAFSYANGAFLVVAGAGVMTDRFLRPAALGLAALWALYAACHVPRFVGSWRPYLGQIAEPAGLAGIALTLAARGPQDPLATAGRIVFGLCLPLYGVVHFLYPDAVAAFIPSWIPARLFWAYFTACAFIAAGLAVLSGVLVRLATVLIAVMFTAWLLVLHLPRLVAALGDPHEWATVFVALAFCGAAWIFAARQR